MESSPEHLQQSLEHYQQRLASIAGRIAILNAEWDYVMEQQDNIKKEIARPYGEPSTPFPSPDQ